MKCTDKTKRHSKAAARQKRILLLMSLLLILLLISAAVISYFKYWAPKEQLAADYEKNNYNQSIYKGTLFSEGLCVASENVELSGSPDSATLKSAALFDVDQTETDFAYNIHERIYPASVTKIMTALLAIEEGNLSDVVTVSDKADSSNFAADEQTCGITAGDQIVLKDLLSGLLLYSGNDAAVAVAEYVAGDEAAFAEKMNARAKSLMATNTHFVNSNGLHNEEHYTTAYDLYLIFNACIKQDAFLEIIQMPSCTAQVTGEDGTVREITWEPTNYYALNKTPLPTQATIVGGKTGTTKDAGNCLILLDRDADSNPFISIVMGAQSKELLYQDMTTLINCIPNNE